MVFHCVSSLVELLYVQHIDIHVPKLDEKTLCLLTQSGAALAFMAGVVLGYGLYYDIDM